MARFVFRLEALLRARRREEEAAQHRVAGLERARLALEGSLRLQRARILPDGGALRERLTGPLDMRELRLPASASLEAMRRVNEIVLQIAVLYRHLEAARARLVEAARGRRALELLRESAPGPPSGRGGAGRGRGPRRPGPAPVPQGAPLMRTAGKSSGPSRAGAHEIARSQRKRRGRAR